VVNCKEQSGKVKPSRERLSSRAGRLVLIEAKFLHLWSGNTHKHPLDEAFRRA